MPELPEVEVIRKGLAPRLVGRRFLTVTAGDKRLRQASSPETLARWLPGRRLERLTRRGKYLVFALEGGVTLLIHLGMTGRLLMGVPPGHGPHVHVFFTLKGCAALRAGPGFSTGHPAVSPRAGGPGTLFPTGDSRVAGRSGQGSHPAS